MPNSTATENKEQRFKRVASKRTEKALDALRKLGNCSNRAIYTYSDEDLSKIFDAIERAVKNIRTLFNTKAKSNKFTL